MLIDAPSYDFDKEKNEEAKKGTIFELDEDDLKSMGEKERYSIEEIKKHMNRLK